MEKEAKKTQQKTVKPTAKKRKQPQATPIIKTLSENMYVYTKSYQKNVYITQPRASGQKTYSFAVPFCENTVRQSVCGGVCFRNEFSFVSFSFVLSKENERNYCTLLRKNQFNEWYAERRPAQADKKQTALLYLATKTLFDRAYAEAFFFVTAQPSLTVAGKSPIGGAEKRREATNFLLFRFLLFFQKKMKINNIIIN